MRKKGYVFLLSFTMLGMVGCATEPTNINVTPTSVVQAESSDIKQTVTPATTPKEEATPTPAKSSAIFSTNTDTKEKKTIIKTDGLCEVIEKVDTSQQATYATYNSFNRMLSNNADKGAIFGDIYCYTPADGKVELVYEAGAIENSKNHRLTVEETGIYFYCEVVEGEKTKYNFYHLPFGATEPIQDTKLTTMKGWKEYVFSFNPNLILESRIAKEDGTREILELSARKNAFCVVENTLYSAERTYISCSNLETGEEIRYDFLEAIKENLSEEDIEDKRNQIIKSFVITETDVWITGSMILYRFNLESKEISYCRLSKGDTTFYGIETLYTDGKELYATCTLGRGKAYLAHIQTDKVELTEANDRIMILDFLTE